TSSCSRPVPNPSPARWCRTRRRTYSRCSASSFRRRPVVRSSSPPESHGVGSGSSLMWTQRIGASPEGRPAISSSPTSSSSPWTLSMLPPSSRLGALVRARHPVRGCSQHLAQHRLDLVELALAGDQRRRELHDRVATIVRAADEPVAVELTGEESAQQVLRLLAVEALLGVAVLDELDREEVPRAAHVADDRDVA